MSVPSIDELEAKLLELLTMLFKFRHQTEHIEVTIAGIITHTPYISIFVKVGAEGDFQYTKATTVANPLAELGI